MERFKNITIIFLLAVVLPASGAKAKSASVLLQEGLYAEEMKGDLDAAIKTYERVLKDFPGNRPVAAKALLHIGLCYEKLGKQEALDAYERVIDQYPEQQEIVKAAMERIDEISKMLEKAANKPNFRRIQVPTKLPFRGSGKLSPDGQKLAFISGGSLWVVPVHGKSSPDIAGTPVRLTDPMHAWDVANVSINWSIDGKWIGFRVAVGREDRNAEEELYIVPAEGGTPKRVPITWKDWAINVHTLRYALSADAGTVYFTQGAKPEETCIYSMPVAGG